MAEAGGKARRALATRVGAPAVAVAERGKRALRAPRGVRPAGAAECESRSPGPARPQQCASVAWRSAGVWLGRATRPEKTGPGLSASAFPQRCAGHDLPPVPRQNQLFVSNNLCHSLPTKRALDLRQRLYEFTEKTSSHSLIKTTSIRRAPLGLTNHTKPSFRPFASTINKRSNSRNLLPSTITAVSVSTTLHLRSVARSCNF